jgi:MFS family permease
MDANVFLPAITAVLAAIFFVALLDQWQARRRGYQLIWAMGILFFGIAVACEAIAAAAGWNEPIYRVWYLTGAVWTAGWLGLGNAFLLGRTRFGFAFALCLFLAGLFTFLTARRNPEIYADASTTAMLYFLVAGVLALAVSVETYFQNWRWPWMALLAVGGATVLSVVLMALASLPEPGYALDPETGVPTAALLPPELRLLTPFMNITGAFALILGALFSAYVFMPKRRILEYSLDPSQPGDQFMFNLLIAPVAILVNFVASLPGALTALFTGKINSRVPATLLIAIGAFIPALTDSLNRFGSTEWFQLGKLLGVLFLLAGFLVSTETFSEIRVPFTSIVLWGRRREAQEATEH